MPGGLSAEPLKAEAFPSATIGVRGVSEDAGLGIDWDSLTFSFTQTDRMFIATCKQGEDWDSGVMQDFQNLSLSPAAGVINYGQGLFEGMKAQYAEDGSLCLHPLEQTLSVVDHARGWRQAEILEVLHHS